MSATTTLAFFGIRFTIDDNEIESFEERTHQHQRLARQLSLDHYWGNFEEPGKRYYSFLGKRLAIIGEENDSEKSYSSNELEKILRETQAKIRSAGIEGEVALYFQSMPDA